MEAKAREDAMKEYREAGAPSISVSHSYALGGLEAEVRDVAIDLRGVANILEALLTSCGTTSREVPGQGLRLDSPAMVEEARLVQLDTSILDFLSRAGGRASAPTIVGGLSWYEALETRWLDFNHRARLALVNERLAELQERGQVLVLETDPPQYELVGDGEVGRG
jgi:hypothetical protein